MDIVRTEIPPESKEYYKNIVKIREEKINKNKIGMSLIKDEILNKEISQPFEVAPIDSPLNVRFFPKGNRSESLFATARYDAVAHCVCIYPTALFGSTEANVEATLRHEKSHAIFLCLSEQDQVKAVDIFLQHPELLRSAYEALRNYGYTFDYFNCEGDPNYQSKSKKLGRCIKVQKPITFEIQWARVGGRTKETVNAAIAVEEVLGWIQNCNVDSEETSFDKLSNSLQSLVQSFSSDEKKLLDDLGLLNVNASDLLRQLQQDAGFREASLNISMLRSKK